MTLHKGKGLEFRQVFLPGWDQGCFPSAFGDADEERRLAYVALTRGMERVSISHVECRRGCTGPSPFLADILRSTTSRAGSARSAPMAAVLVASGGTTWRMLASGIGRRRIHTVIWRWFADAEWIRRLVIPSTL